jgi:phage FluMu protein Com
MSDDRMIEVRCNQCGNFLFEASADSVALIVMDCKRCKQRKAPKFRREISLPFKGAARRKDLQPGPASR